MITFFFVRPFIEFPKLKMKSVEEWINVNGKIQVPSEIFGINIEHLKDYNQNVDTGSIPTSIL